MADYVSGEEKCGAPAPNGASACARYVGHTGDHRNAWSTAEWPSEKLCGNVGPFDGMTCARYVGHSGAHVHPRSGMKMMWSDVTEESVAKQLTGLQRKVKAQANQINKLEELRRATVDKQPEYQSLLRNLEAQASLTTRENTLRRQAETERGSDRERRAELITNQVNDIRHHFGEPPVAGSATWADLRAQVGRLTDRERQFRIRAQRELDDTCDRLNMVNVKSSDRFRKLGAALGVDTSGQTWDNLIHRVAELKKAGGAPSDAEERAAVARQDLYRLIGLVGAENWNHRRQLVSVADLSDVAEGVRGALVKLEHRVDELAKSLSRLELETIRRCESWNSGTRCVSYAGHMGAHHAGSETERWA